MSTIVSSERRVRSYNIIPLYPNDTGVMLISSYWRWLVGVKIFVWIVFEQSL